MKILTIAVQTKGHGSYARQRRMADALIQRGHEVLWMAPGTDFPGEEQLLPVDPLWLPVPRPLVWQARLWKAFRKFKKELSQVDAVFTVREYDSLACVLNRTLKGKPHIFFQRGDVIECEKFNFRHPVYLRDRIVRPLTIAIYAPLQRWLLPKVTMTVFQAQFLAELVKQRLPNVKFLYKILANDCNIRWVHEKKENDGDRRISAIKKDGVPLIGIVAPLYWHGKGIGVFLEALHLLKGRSSFRACIVGYGPNEDQVKQFISDNQMEEDVFFLGRIQGAFEYMHLFDLMVMPTKMVDACPNVVLEALASKIPVIASDIAAHRNLLKYDELLFPNTDSKALAEKLYNLLQNNDLFERCRQLVLERQKYFDFDWDSALVQLVEDTVEEVNQSE